MNLSENEKSPARQEDIEKTIIKQYRKSIWRPFVKALNEYDMIRPGDEIAVCISGGKDSFLLAKCMQEILRHGKMDKADWEWYRRNRQLVDFRRKYTEAENAEAQKWGF